MKIIRNIIAVELLVNLLVLAISIAVAHYSHANTVLVLVCVYGTAFLAGLASLYAVLAAMHGNTDQFPYGTGRLENACAFTNILLLCTCAAFSLSEATKAMFFEVPHQPRLDLAMIPLSLSLICNIGFYVALRRMHDATDERTPIMESYFVMYHTATIRDAVLVASMLIGFVMCTRRGFQPVHIDSVIAGALAIYIIGAAGPLAKANFRALVDFPLPEDMQIQILKVLGKHFDAYEDIGRIYNTHRGNNQVIEVELMFHGDLLMESLHELQDSMQKDMSDVLPKAEFRIIPLQATNVPVLIA